MEVCGRQLSLKEKLSVMEMICFYLILTNTELEFTTANMGMDTNFCQQRKERMVLKDKKKKQKKTIQGGEKFKKIRVLELLNDLKNSNENHKKLHRNCLLKCQKNYSSREDEP